MADAYALHRSPLTPPFAPLRYVLRRMASRALHGVRHGAGDSAAFGDVRRAIVGAFMHGYAIALDARDEEEAVAQLDSVELVRRGFAYEGASMAFALVDALLPRRPTRVARFSTRVASAHLYMVYVGTGWAAARLRQSPDRARRGLDSLLGWLAVDGYGFHEGYFRSDRVIRSCTRPRRAAGYALRAFDQGVGRSLWFVDAGQPDDIARSIARFPLDRHADLWSGVGLAAAYAGGASADHLRSLKGHAGVHVRQLAQGAAFAAEARARAQNPAVHTDAACEVFASHSAEDAARLVRELRDGAADAPDAPAYEVWRRRVAAACS